MRIKEISFLVATGVLSIATLLILKLEAQYFSPKASPSEVLHFEDTSSLAEYAMPLPTAEPPLKSETEGEEAKPALSPSNLIVQAETPMDLPETATPLIGTPQPAPEGTQTEATEGSISDTFLQAIKTKSNQPAETTPIEDPSTLPSIIEETPEGFWLRSAKLNDVFQHLAQLGNYQYFHNTEIDGASFVVTGQLMNDDPIRQMEELALMYGITIHRKGNTVYALTAPQLSQLPTEPFRYQLKYLRPKDIEQIKLILQPFLTPGSGIIEFESKTNTLIVMDNARRLEALALFLSQIDQPKQQVAIETRILRITSDSANRIGVDWTSVLGENGTSITSATSLNALFNLPDLATAASFITASDDGNSLTTRSTTASGFFRDAGDAGGSGSTVLSPLQLNAVLRALNEGNLAQQESSPTLIAEDNEEGLISIIDRIPIVTSTVTITDGSQNITDEVRYKIDEEDPSGDPNTTREVGVSVSVTPTILPDNTIRMSLRPRAAQVTDYITTPSGNLYPRVNESTVTTTARVPNGHSLLIGGFYEEIESDKSSKVPILGDMPAVNLLFKSSSKQKKNTSLVFIVTPTLYHPEITSENDIVSHEIHESHILPSNHNYPDHERPGGNYEPNLRNSMRNAFKANEPDAPNNILHPEHPYNRPVALPVHGKDYPSEPQFATAGNRPQVTVRPSRKKNSGFLGKVFGGNN